MCFPENTEIFVSNKFVVRVIGGSLLERWVSCIHNEQNDSGCENIGFGSFVIFVWNLWSHVAFSTQFSVEHS